jgi:HEAT repeat protein
MPDNHDSKEGKRRSGSITAEELLAELEADAEYVAKRDEREQELQRRQGKWRRAEAPLVDELRKAGLQVDSVWDLVNTSTPYPQALPILVKHLERRYPDRVREGIARALAVRDAQFAWDDLVRLYEQEPAGTDAKDGLAVAIAAASSTAVVDDVISLAEDPVHGKSRILLIRALRRSRAGHAREALKRLETDPVLAVEVRRVLKRQRT